MTQKVYFGVGAIGQLQRVLDQLRARRVFLVTGRESFAACGAAAALEPLLNERHVHRHFGFTENPKIEDAISGVRELHAERPDVIVAVGGGSVLDMAKLVNILAHHDSDALDVIRGNAPIRGRGLPLVAIPTTSGSGSDATHFAVVYIDRVKYSLASQYLLPNVAIVDPLLTYSLSPRLTAVTGMDAFAQAVESYWCVHSTQTSKAFAQRAIALVFDNLRPSVHAPTPQSRRAMSKAARLAGQAINITKTTGPHALSYPLTSYFGIPHGHAVCLTLGRFLVHNSEVTDRDVTDVRGATYVRGTVEELVHLMGCDTAGECLERIDDLIGSIGLEGRLGDLGISPAEAVECVVRNVNVERMANNPRALDHDSLTRLVQAIC